MEALLLVATGSVLCAPAAWSQAHAGPEDLLADRGAVVQASTGSLGLHAGSPLRSQSPMLGQVIDVTLTDATVEQALQHVAAKAGLRLSYGSRVVDVPKRVTMDQREITARAALRDILDGTGIQTLEDRRGLLILVKRPELRARSAARLPVRVPATGLQAVRLQRGVVAGRVVEAGTGEPLPGVNVVLVGTQQGASTDLEGRYRIAGIEPGLWSLQASFIGYAPQTIDSVRVVADETTEVDFALEEAEIGLDELVVVGYGVQEEADLTGVIQKVSAEDFNAGQVVSPEQLIAGKVAGVQITPSTGEPGGQSLIRIRGGTSVNASNEPLFVIDGVPIDNDPYNPGDLSTGRSPLNFLNPNDIESITVLKDASATAIYGSRGANGVVIIETKGAGDGAQISYDGSVSTSSVVETSEVLSADAFRRVVSENAPDMMGLLGGADSDWQDAVLEDGIGQEHTLSFSRGGEDLGYRISLGYLDQEGVVRRSSTERTSLAVNYSQRLLEDRLNLTASLKGSRTEDRFVPGDVVGNAAAFAPTQPIEDAENASGFFEWDADGQLLAENNPVAELRLTDEQGVTYRSIGNLEGEYELPFVDGLSARLNLGYDVTRGERERFLPTFLQSQVESANPGEVRRANFTRLNTLLDAYLNYATTFEQYASEIDLTAGYSYQNFASEFPEFWGQGLTTNIFGVRNSDVALLQQSAITEIENRLISGFGRLNYTFRDRYLLTFTIRRDGSSRFGPENRWGTFPSLALGWRIGDERFMEGVPALSDLKLRASWGITGNQEIGDFQYVKTYVYGEPQARVQFGDGFVTTLRPSSVDSDLKWEETTSYNLGLDYELFDGRVSGALEYYYKETDDLLFNTAVAAGSNLSNFVLTNIGTVRNEGVEFNVNGLVFEAGEFSWNAGFNVSTNSNELLRISAVDDPNFQGFDAGGIAGAVGNTIQILREGEPVNAFFVYRHLRGPDGQPLRDGVDHNGDGEVNLADLYEDTSGDGVVNELDRAPFESPFPDWVFGHTSQMRYRALDLSFSLRAHLGNYVYNNVASNFGHFSRLTDVVPSNLHASVLETQFTQPQYFSDVYVEDASFLRMDNVTLGYTFRGIPSVSQLRVYGTVDNVFVITGYGGADPEIGNISGDEGDARIGIDDNIYPRSRTFTAGISLQF